MRGVSTSIAGGTVSRRVRASRRAWLAPGLFALAFLAAGAASSEQTVWLDFATDNDPGEHVYTAAEQTAIRDLIAADYSAFDFSFSLTQPSSGTYSTLTFNADGIEGGLADAIDFRNLNHGDNGRINVNSFLGGSIPATSANFIGMASGVGAHELGHIVGLRHHDSMGPIGAGISPDPGSVPYHPDYPGPTGANETAGHTMASPASVGSPLSALAGNTFLSERSAVKLSFNEQGSAVAEQTAAHQTLATAQSIALSNLNVPNTLVSGINAGVGFAVAALAVTGELDAFGQIDFYSFSAEKDELFNFEVISNVLDRIVNPIDPEIRIFDADENLVPYYTSSAFNDDEFESQDSILVDLTIPETATYYVRINAFNASDQGNYELFGYRLSVVPEPGTFSLLGLGLMTLALRRAGRRDYTSLR